MYKENYIIFILFLFILVIIFFSFFFVGFCFSDLIIVLSLDDEIDLLLFLLNNVNVF